MNRVGFHDERVAGLKRRLSRKPHPKLAAVEPLAFAAVAAPAAQSVVRGAVEDLRAIARGGAHPRAILGAVVKLYHDGGAACVKSS